MSKVKRDAVIFLRMTEEEKQEIEKNAKEARFHCLNEYCLRHLLNNPIILIDDLSKFLAELHKQGSNLNQVAKVANTQKYVSKEILAELKKSTAAFDTVSNLVTYSRRLRGGGASRSRQPMLPVSTS